MKLSNRTLYITITIGVIVILIGAGAIASGNGHADSPKAATSEKAAIPEVDPEDPTPGTEGRMTEEEEAAWDSIVAGAIELAGSPAFRYSSPAGSAAMADQYIRIQLQKYNMDTEDIKRRDAEATADGYPVEQEGLPGWRMQGIDAGYDIEPDSSSYSGEPTSVEPDEAPCEDNGVVVDC